MNDHHPKSIHIHSACPLRSKQGLGGEVTHIAVVAGSGVEAILKRITLSTEPSIPTKTDKSVTSREEDVMASTMDGIGDAH